ncbi:MAG: class I SAM-dependent methyltransferase [Ilumatobacteraceae bacterium]
MTENVFDDKAASWDDDPAKVERATAIADLIVSTIELDDSIRLLEYGAGTGLVSHALQDSVGPVTMADTSAGMRDVMLAKIAAGTIRNGRVWDVDLAADPTPDERFDLIVTVLTLHHIHDVSTVLDRFAALLDRDGWLCVVELDHEDGSFHGADADVHHGFGRDEMADLLTAAGFASFEFHDCHHVDRNGQQFPMFLAVAHLDAGRTDG